MISFGSSKRAPYKRGLGMIYAWNDHQEARRLWIMGGQLTAGDASSTQADRPLLDFALVRESVQHINV